MRLDRGQIEVVDDMVAEILSRKTYAERIKIGVTCGSQRIKCLQLISILKVSGQEVDLDYIFPIGRIDWDFVKYGMQY